MSGCWLEKEGAVQKRQLLRVLALRLGTRASQLCAPQSSAKRRLAHPPRGSATKGMPLSLMPGETKKTPSCAS